MDTTPSSIRSAFIDDIQDENVLREMWMQATDVESKRQIRSRMYKLREERLKDIYNREGILENILKNHGEDTTTTKPISQTSVTEDMFETPDPKQSTIAKGTKKEALKSKIGQVDRSRQFQDIRTRQQRNNVKEVADLPDTKLSANNRSVGLIPGIKSHLKNDENIIQRNRGGRTTSPPKTKHSLAENENNMKNQREIVSPEKLHVTKKVAKGIMSQPQKRIDKPLSRAEKSVMDTKPKLKATTPRFMASTKSRDNALTLNPNHVTKEKNESTRVAKAPKHKSSVSPERSQTKPKISTAQPPQRGYSPQTSFPSASELRKELFSDSDSKKSPVVKKDRSPTLLIDKIETKPTDAEDYIIRELDILDNYLAQRSTSIEEKQPLNPTKESEEMDKRSRGAGTSKEQKGTTKKKDQRQEGRNKTPPPYPSEKNMVDVQETGEEPIVTRSVFNYGHTDPGARNANLEGFRAVDASAASGPDAARVGPEKDAVKSKEWWKSSGYEAPKQNYLKYDYDILNRPSIFEKKCCVSGAQASGGGQGATTHRVVKKSEADFFKMPSSEDIEELDDEMEMTFLSKNKDLLRKGLKSPGVVLKAKSMFEKKAAESMAYKPSGGFQKTPIKKVSKNVAIFESIRTHEFRGLAHAEEPMMVQGVSIGSPRKPGQSSPELKKPFAERTTKKKVSLDTPVEVDSKIIAERAKGISVLVGKKSPSPTPRAVLPNEKKTHVGTIKTKESLEYGKGSPKSLKPAEGLHKGTNEVTPEERKIVKKFQVNAKSHSSVGSSEAGISSRVPSTKRNSLSEAKAILQAEAPEDSGWRSREEKMLTGLLKKSDSLKTLVVKADLANESNANIEPIQPSSAIQESQNAKTTTPAIKKSSGKTYIVRHVQVDTPVKTFQRMNTLDLITSAYGTGPVDDEGKPLFGLKALRRAKELNDMQMQNANTALNGPSAAPIDAECNLIDEKAMEKLEECKEDESRSRIERRLQCLGAIGGSMSVSKQASRSADVTGELMPFILGQLQTSLENYSDNNGGDGSVSRSNKIVSITNPNPVCNPGLGSMHDSSPDPQELNSTSTADEQTSAVEECLFDSGTESGEDSPEPPPLPPKKKSSPGEFSTFMEGLRHSLTREGLGLFSSLSGSELSSGRKGSLPVGKSSNASLNDSGVIVPETDLIQQVEKILNQLRESLIKDPNCLNQTLKSGAKKSGTELIALIDRLKSSLQTPSESLPVPLPLVVGCNSPPKEPQPPDLIPSRRLPWAGSDSGDGPWKIRAAAKRRSTVRSRSIGVSEDELEEARRHLQEEAFRSAFRDDQASAPSKLGVGSKSWKEDIEKQLSNLPKPNFRMHETKRLCSLDDSLVQGPEHQKLKPFRTFSLDNPMSSTDLDPSRLFFTPEEVVQIAIHKAAINKQVSDEEDRRRRSSITSNLSFPKQGAQPPRDFTLGLPKPYVPPSSSSSDDQESRAGQRKQSGQILLYNNGNGKPSTTNLSESPSSSLQALNKRSIENVQISLQESGDFPQLQIAITLNTNPTGNQDVSKKRSKSECEEIEAAGQGRVSSDDSTKAIRYRTKNERKKKIKRANTIDVPPSPDFDGDDGNEESDEETVVPPQPTIKPNEQRFCSFLEKMKHTEPPPKPAFLSVNGKHWNNRFSNLKTSFESSSQGSSPSISPIPASSFLKSQSSASAQGKPQFKPSQEQHSPHHKPVWASGGSSDGNSPVPSCSVRNKLSVFENRSDSYSVPSPHFNKLSEQWGSKSSNAATKSLLNATKSSILQKRENFEKLSEEIQTDPGLGITRKQMGIFMQKQFQQPAPILPFPPPTQRTKPQLPPLYEGVHTVHATKSAMEAMQRQQQLPPRINPQQNCELTGNISQPQANESIQSWQHGNSAVIQQAPVTPFETPQALSVPANIPKSNIALRKTEFENFQAFGANHPPTLKQRASAFESAEQGTPRGPKMSVLGVAKSFDDAYRHKMERSQEFSNTSLILNQSSHNSLYGKENDPGTLNSPVLSKVMKGPQQQRATFSGREISSLGSDHPSAERIRNAQGAIGRSIFQPPREPQQQKFAAFPPRSLQLPPLVKSQSGDALGFTSFKVFPNQGAVPSPTLSSSPIPRQKSLSEFPPPEPQIRTGFPSSPSNTLSNSVSVSNPALPTTPKSTFPFQSPSDHLKRTSSGSSIFDRTKSLYISSQDSLGPPKAPVTQQRKKPPSLPNAKTLFPKQYEAQMSPESADKKQREVEAFFKFKQQNKNQDQDTPPPPPPSVPSRYLKGRKDEGYQNKIRKSASQGKIMNRQKSYSDGDDEDDNVDQIFESLFKASVESKMAKSSVSGDTKSNEVAELKATKSATQSKSLEKSASVQESKTATGSTTVAVQKQSSVSKSSYSSSSTATSAKVTTSKTTSGSPFSKFKELDEKNSTTKTGQGKTIFKFTNPALKTSANSIKEGLLVWCQGRTREYQNVKIDNFSSSWSDGLAFCALIHHFFKDAFDYESLSPKNKKYNFELAFRVADEKGGIYPLLDPEDMVAMGNKPDWKCVFTYVQSMYQKLKDL